MYPLLIARNSLPGEQVIALDHFPVLLGRSPDADVMLTDRWVSRRHCQLEWHGDTLWVRDLESTHGVCVSGKQV